MQNVFKKLSLILVLFLSMTFGLAGQTEAAQWSFGLGIGKMEYNGDRGSNAIYQSPTNIHVGTRLSKYMSPLFDVSLAASLGRQGLYDRTDAPNQFEGTAFQTSLGFHLKPVDSRFIQPFVSLAVGYFNYSDASPSTVIARGTNSSGMTIPIGLGLKINFNDGFGLYYHSTYSAEYTGDAYNGVFNDSKDKYWLHELGLAFNFGMQDRDGDRVADEKDNCPDTPGLKKMQGCPDSDLDGVIDSEDDCPYTAGPVELRGCPDSDNDGIIDKDDSCPDTAGEARYQGCPDTDNDGIGDHMDKCPDVPGLERYAGCPIPDSDNDGFNDEDDECPQVKGELRGCPDSDGDGFHDSEDECVNEAGTARGCPDRDNDGIADNKDECPDEAGIPEKNGCPEFVPPTREELINSWKGPNIQFISGTRPDENYEENIQTILDFHKQYSEAYIHLGGYSDSSGSESSNMRISKLRAQKVYDRLVSEGIPSDNLTYEAYGEANPVGDNDTREGRLKNRRVEVSASTVKRVIEMKNIKR